MGEVSRSELDVVVDFQRHATLFCGFPQSVALVLGFAKVNDHFRETILRDTRWAR